MSRTPKIPWQRVLWFWILLLSLGPWTGSCRLSAVRIEPWDWTREIMTLRFSVGVVDDNFGVCKNEGP